jgi:hypothetical protein
MKADGRPDAAEKGNVETTCRSLQAKADRLMESLRAVEAAREKRVERVVSGVPGEVLRLLALVEVERVLRWIETGRDGA